MPRKPDKTFERKIILLRNQIEKRGVRMIYKALSEQYKQFLNSIDKTNIQTWEKSLDNITEEPIRRFFEKYYVMAAPFAMMSREHALTRKKDEEEQFYTSLFERRMFEIMNTTAGSKITTITGTTKKRIERIIVDVLTDGEVEGFGIDKIANRLFQAVGDSLKGNARARAQAIAQTEIISAQNQASTYGIESTDLPYKKYWSTSGLENIRDSHQAAENYSEAMDGLLPHEKFEPVNMLYPGDPDGDVSELVNCRCTVLHVVQKDLI